MCDMRESWNLRRDSAPAAKSRVSIAVTDQCGAGLLLCHSCPSPTCLRLPTQEHTRSTFYTAFSSFCLTLFSPRHFNIRRWQNTPSLGFLPPLFSRPPWVVVTDQHPLAHYHTLTFPTFSRIFFFGSAWGRPCARSFSGSELFSSLRPRPLSSHPPCPLSCTIWR